MIKKLRIKFIILSTVSLLLLLAIIVVSSNMLSYRELVSNADMVLSFISKNDGKPMHKLPPEMIKFDKDNNDNPNIFPQKRMSPEMMYEARFFTVNISDDGEIIKSDTQNIAMIDDDMALKYGGLAAQKSSDKGFVSDFRYNKIKREDDTCIIFLDCGRKLNTFKNSLYINCLISFAGLLVICVIIIFYSKKIVEPVAEGYEKQKQFISMAGHEIKTPITIIDADAEILSMEIGEDNEWLEDICVQTKRMAALTNDMLNLSRMDENRQQFNMIDFPISDVVGEVVQSFQALAKNSGKHIQADITPMLSYKGDENSIRQITGILLDNAVKYAKDENVFITLEKKNHNVILTVKNSSEPVADEQLKHFFDRFYRTEQSGKTKGGYGLGLAIAKSIVETHKGRISASTPYKDVVKITVILPIKSRS